jgi:hypothetical protein
VRPWSLLLVVSLCAAPAARGQDAIDPKKLEESIAKGKAWLVGLQQPDGSFKLPPAADTLETGFPLGYCSLATLTLLKCGLAPDDPVIVRSFDHLYALPLRKTYEVATLVLAIEARFAPPDEAQDPEKKSYTTVARAFFGKRARPIDREKLQACVDWLVAHRSKQFEGAGWRYPQGEIDLDNSNTQYAMLALKSARRLGADVPADVFAKVADFFVAQQDATGPAVQWFPVPAADGPIAEMLGLDKRRELERARARAAEREREREAGTRERERRGPDETVERATMHARGWSYEPREPVASPPASREGPTPPQTGTKVSTGSMTSSGVAALCIAKSELENTPALWRPRQAAVETAIRDGVAWLAKHFSATDNPRADASPTGWKYYYLYSVERAGVLAGTYRFGAHDWWEEGAAHLLTLQEAEGTWPDTKGLSRLAHTCFALLFLTRSTIPLMPLPPKRVMTGGKR